LSHLRLVCCSGQPLGCCTFPRFRNVLLRAQGKSELHTGFAPTNFTSICLSRCQGVTPTSFCTNIRLHKLAFTQTSLCTHSLLTPTIPIQTSFCTI
jgi:hypothetical protein